MSLTILRDQRRVFLAGDGGTQRSLFIAGERQWTSAGIIPPEPEPGAPEITTIEDGGYRATTASIDANGKLTVSNARSSVITTENNFGVDQWVLQLDGMRGKSPALDRAINGADTRNNPTPWPAAWAKSLLGPWRAFSSASSDGSKLIFSDPEVLDVDRIYIAGKPLILQVAWDALIGGWIANPLTSPTPSGDANYVSGVLPPVPALSIPAKNVHAFQFGTGPHKITLTTGVHPEEHIGMHVFCGCVDFLLGPSAEAARLRSMFTFLAYPNLNPQSRYVGASRVEVESGTWQNANRIFGIGFDSINLSRVMRSIWATDIGLSPVEMVLDFHDNPFGENYTAEVILRGTTNFLSSLTSLYTPRTGRNIISRTSESPDTISDHLKLKYFSRQTATIEHGYLGSFGPADWRLWGEDVAKAIGVSYPSAPAVPAPWQEPVFLPADDQVTVTRDTNGDWLITSATRTPSCSMLVPAGKNIEFSFEGRGPGTFLYVAKSAAQAMTSRVDLTPNLGSAPFLIAQALVYDASRPYLGINTGGVGTVNRTIRLSASCKWRTTN